MGFRMFKVSGEEELLVNVGLCLREWSRIENGLAELYAALNGCDPMPHHPVRAGFETVKSFEVKTAIVLAQIQSDDSLSKEFLEAYRPLHNKLGKMARKRAEVAHFNIVYHHDAKSPAGRAMLHPFWTWSGQFYERNRRPLSAGQLLTRAKAFGLLADRMHRCAHYIQQTSGNLPLYLQQQADPAHWLRFQSESSPNPKEGE